MNSKPSAQVARWAIGLATCLLAASLPAASALFGPRADGRWGDDLLVYDDAARTEAQFHLAIGPSGVCYALVEYPDADQIALMTSEDAGVTWQIRKTFGFSGAGWGDAALGAPQTIDDCVYVAIKYDQALYVHIFRTTTWSETVRVAKDELFVDGIRDLAISVWSTVALRRTTRSF